MPWSMNEGIFPVVVDFLFLYCLYKLQTKVLLYSLYSTSFFNRAKIKSVGDCHCFLAGIVINYPVFIVFITQKWICHPSYGQRKHGMLIFNHEQAIVLISWVQIILTWAAYTCRHCRKSDWDKSIWFYFGSSSFHLKSWIWTTFHLKCSQIRMPYFRCWQINIFNWIIISWKGSTKQFGSERSNLCYCRPIPLTI